jgi:hypothetical protein
VGDDRRSRRARAGTRASTLAGGLAIALTASACHAGASAASTTTTVPTTPATTARATTTTTQWTPRSPQASAYEAAALLVEDWAAADRPAAAEVAAPRAVANLFEIAYPGDGLAIPRGCSDEFQPIVCTYGPPGGADPNDPIFELDVSQRAGGWYVSSVTVLP